MAPHSSTLAWKVPWTEEPGGLRSMGLLRVGHDWATSLSLFTFMHWRRKRQPTPVFLPGESGDGGAWWAAVSGVAQSQTWLKRLSSSSSSEEVGFPGDASGKESTCQCRRLKSCGFGTWVRKIPLEEGTATHPSILAWRIPWTKEPGRKAAVHRVTQSWTWLKRLSRHAQGRGRKFSTLVLKIFVHFLTSLVIDRVRTSPSGNTRNCMHLQWISKGSVFNTSSVF